MNMTPEDFELMTLEQKNNWLRFAVGSLRQITGAKVGLLSLAFEHDTMTNLVAHKETPVAVLNEWREAANAFATSLASSGHREMVVMHDAWKDKLD